MKLVFATLILLVGGLSQAQSIAKPGHECGYQMVVPSLTCVNPKSGPDIRLSITEYQTCENGSIIDFSRTVSGLFSNGRSILPLSSDEVTISFDQTRMHLDDRGGDFTFVLPKTARVDVGSSAFFIDISRTRVLDHEDASEEQWSYVGSFVQKSGSREISRGALSCGFNL